MLLRDIDSVEEIERRVGKAPYFGVNNQSGLITPVLDARLVLREPYKQIYSLYAYGYDKQDGLEYLPKELVNSYFQQKEEMGSYDVIEDGELCSADWDYVEYLNENNVGAIVNCKPVKQFFDEEMQARIEKSNSIRR